MIRIIITFVFAFFCSIADAAIRVPFWGGILTKPLMIETDIFPYQVEIAFGSSWSSAVTGSGGNTTLSRFDATTGKVLAKISYFFVFFKF